MNITEIIGWIGFILLITAWIPQTLQTIKDGQTSMNLVFIILYVVSSIFLTIYAVLNSDYVFITLNALLTIGSGLNLFYKLNPRKKNE